MIQTAKFWIINIGITALTGLIAKISFEPLQDYLRYLVQELALVVNIVTDANPDNAGQLKDFG